MGKAKDYATEVTYQGGVGDVIWRSDISKIHINAKIYSRKDADIIFLRKGAFMASFNDKKEFYRANDEREGLFAKIFKNSKVSEDVEIFYINRLAQLENKWGTASRIQIYDKDYDMHTSIGANGTYKFSVSNAMKLFSKVQGNAESLSQDKVQEFFRSELNQEIRSAIANIFKKNRYSLKDIATITTYEKELAEDIESILKPIFEDYGVALNRFFIHNIAYDEDFLTRISQAKQDVIIEGMKDKMVDKQLERERDNFTMRQDAAVKMKKAENPNTEEKNQFCNECGAKNSEDAKFCKDCGHPLQSMRPTHCKKCGTELPETGKFCGECGEKV